ncbi:MULTISPECIES: hypothetical protein [unclassified Sphingomonas]|uniref:hypothetical protein n=1 Tax=unclassified Sphingomonas TaxID=196159 RepID=UPI002269E3DA|nr:MULTISPECIES: hypothetical protein [unclassified Sphingomonas]
MIRKYLAAVAATALVATPVVAAPAKPAANLSVSKSVRASAPSAQKSKIGGGSALIAVLAAAAVGAGIYVAVDKNDDDADSN